jgi:hypothetical protein
MSSELDGILELLDDEQLVILLTDAVDQYSPSYAEEPAMQVFAARLNECGVVTCASRCRQVADRREIPAPT